MYCFSDVVYWRRYTNLALVWILKQNNDKDRTFWETQKIQKNLPHGLDKSADLLGKRQNHEDDFYKLCVLLEKSKLYQTLPSPKQTNMSWKRCKWPFFFWWRFKKSLLKIQGDDMKSDLQPRESSLPEQAKVGFWIKIFLFQPI